MDSIISMLSKISFFTIIPTLILIFKMVIDSFNITGVEKSIMPDSKKIGIYFSHMIVYSIIGGLTLFLLMIFSDSDKLNVNDVLVKLIASLIIMFVMSLIISLFVFSIVRLFSVTMQFYIIYEGQEWRIERRVDKSKLLVSRESNIYKFIDAKNIIDTEIIRKIDAEKFKKIPFHDMIVKKVKMIGVILIVLIVSILILMFSLDGKARISFAIILLILYVISMYILIVLKNNKIIQDVYKKMNLNMQQD